MDYERFTNTDINFVQERADQITGILFNPKIDLQGREMIIASLISEMGERSELSVQQASDAVEILHEIIAEG